jgi:hypothetical protein
MFSGGAFGEFGFGEHGFTPLDTSAFSAFLAKIGIERCFLVEIEALSLAASGGVSGAFSDHAFSESGFGSAAAVSAGGVQTLRYSSNGYTRLDLGLHYEPRLKGDVAVSRAIIGRDGVAGLARVSAELTLSNADGALDELLDQYALDGRPVRVLIGPADGDYADFGLYFSGVFDRGTVTDDSFRIQLSDGMARLELPVQSNTYGGTGGLDGGADLKGKPKPLCWGAVANVSPVLVDAVNLIYQVHDGAIQDVPAVRDRGVALTRVLGAPAPGEYQPDLATGTFRLGAAPDGKVTCDVEGDAPPAGYTDRTAVIAQRILASKLYTSEIDTTAFANLDGVAIAPVGYYIGAESVTAAEVLDELLTGIGAFGGFSRTGTFTTAIIDAANGAPAASFNNQDIIELSREPLPAAVDPIAWRVAVAWGRNYTVQPDLAALATDADRSFAAEPHRVAAREDVAIKSRHLLARDYGTRPALFRDAADAEAEAARLFSLWGVSRRLLRVTVPLHGLLADIGSVVHLSDPRHRLQFGADARVVGHAARGVKTELRVIV